MGAASYSALRSSAMKRFLEGLFAYPLFTLVGLVSVAVGVVVGSAILVQNVFAHHSALLNTHDLAAPASAPILFPAHQATMVNPDVQLKLTFNDTPSIGKSGKIRIYDASDNRMVDMLDMSIPPGPSKPVDPAVRAKNYLAFPYPYARTSRPTNANTKPGTPTA